MASLFPRYSRILMTDGTALMINDCKTHVPLAYLLAWRRRQGNFPSCWSKTGRRHSRYFRESNRLLRSYLLRRSSVTHSIHFKLICRLLSSLLYPAMHSIEIAGASFI